MHTENGLLVDLEQVRRVVSDADVFTVAFRLFPERLLIDARYDQNDPEGPTGMPMVAIVDPVATVQERFFWLGQHRPSLGMPDNFQFFFWPHSVTYLEESGVWSHLRARMVATGFGGAADTCDDALSDLIARERAANAKAIRGDGYHAVWEASAG
jgi:hypothetical protein